MAIKKYETNYNILFKWKKENKKKTPGLQTKMYGTCRVDG
jgi:hypothetical protein